MNKLKIILLMAGILLSAAVVAVCVNTFDVFKPSENVAYTETDYMAESMSGNEFSYTDETLQSEIDAIHEEIKTLPDIMAMGTVPPLQEAMLEDKTGVLPTLVKQFVESESLEEREELIDKILFRFCGVSILEADHNGSNADVRKYTVVQAFTGEDFNPRKENLQLSIEDLAYLENNYTSVKDMYYYDLLKDKFTKFILYYRETEDAKGNEYNECRKLFSEIDTALEKGNLSETDFIELCKRFASKYKTVFARVYQYYTAKDEKYEKLFEEHCIDSVGTENDDSIAVTKKGSVIFAKAGNDVIDGTAGDDLYVAGAGKDAIRDCGGDDVYLFDTSYGTDIIFDSTGINTIVFTDNIKPQDLEFSKNKENLDIHVKNTDNRITLLSYFINEDCDFRLLFNNDEYAYIDKENVTLGKIEGPFYTFKKGDGVSECWGEEKYETLKTEAEIKDIIFSANSVDIAVSLRKTEDKFIIKYWEEIDVIKNITSSDGYTIDVSDISNLISEIDTFTKEKDITWEEALEKYPDETDDILKKHWQTEN
ncbi:MAG: calcium-binding protein [Ruminococcus sp.]|nr:calcium-binding protein [Ruminococcus sp.]